MNRLEEGRVSLSVGGSQSRLMGVGAGVDGKEGVGAGVHGAPVVVLGGWIRPGGEEESEADLSVTGALTEDLAED